MYDPAKKSCITDYSSMCLTRPHHGVEYLVIMDSDFMQEVDLTTELALKTRYMHQVYNFS